MFVSVVVSVVFLPFYLFLFVSVSSELVSECVFVLIYDKRKFQKQVPESY